MLKDFVFISSNTIQIHMNVEKLLFVLHNAELLENEMIAKLSNLKLYRHINGCFSQELS